MPDIAEMIEKSVCFDLSENFVRSDNLLKGVGTTLRLLEPCQFLEDQASCYERVEKFD